MTRVLHLSVVHKPDDPRIYERECRTLAQAGYEVIYLAPGAAQAGDDAGVLLAPLPVRGRSTRFLSTVEITSALRALRPDVLHVHDPELLTLFPAAKPFVPRLVYDMHEYVPEAVAGKPYIPERGAAGGLADHGRGAEEPRGARRRRGGGRRGPAEGAGQHAGAAPRAAQLPARRSASPAPSRCPSSPPTRASSSSTSAASRAPAAAP